MCEVGWARPHHWGSGDDANAEIGTGFSGHFRATKIIQLARVDMPVAGRPSRNGTAADDRSCAAKCKVFRGRV